MIANTEKGASDFALSLPFFIKGELEGNLKKIQACIEQACIEIIRFEREREIINSLSREYMKYKYINQLRKK
jgi:hypothetical protein